jgi:hypothetical protein
MLTRRDFTKLTLATLALAFPGCTRSSDYSDDDVARLTKQMADEAAGSGTRQVSGR